MDREKLFDTDRLMNSLWHWLVRDFRSLLDDPSFMVEQEAALPNKAAFRKTLGGSYYLSPHLYFKCRYQMENLFKRYTFKSDLFSKDELEIMTNQKFVETQIRVGTYKEPTQRAFLVLQRARSICRVILGKYDQEEHYRSCRFGKRASVGVPRSQSYLDERLSRPLSGSRAHIRWFKDYLSSDQNLERILCELHESDTPLYDLCDTLTLTNVPKSYKALRSILPNTTIGGFYTYGLGKMVQSRLAKVRISGRMKLDIRRLQEFHRKLVRKFSRTGSHVTADLSAASDSFTWSLLCRVLPRDWLAKLKLGRIKNAVVGGKKIHLSSFMTMGIGFTFQVQTLVFYSLLKSIQELSGEKGLISVYGDDLVYPKGMHRYVSAIFQDIGFILNEDKTFVKESFRESCGADFYCGVDVRPFQPEGQASLLPRQKYLVLLYKTINGLRRRWEDFTINQTLRFLYSEILSCADEILQVPPSFPDYSGVQVDRPRQEFLMPWAVVTRDHNLSLVFAFLKLCPRDRFVVHQAPYLWDKLRDPNPERDEDYANWWEIVPPEVRGESIFRWVKAKYQPKNYRSTLTGKRLKRLQATIADASGSFTVIRQTRSTCVWS